MGWLYRGLVRPALFTQDSEQIHNRTLRVLGRASHSALLRAMVGSVCRAPALPIKAFGLTFPNPIGLAAGMDKKAEAVPMWASLGFGFSELGGVTRHEQPGNDRPRMFRVIPDAALINRMGFNNPGADAFTAALESWRASGLWPSHPVGVNLGKSKITPLEQAAEDYAYSFRRAFRHADFFVINVSSPNTPNLRKLQDKAALDEIFARLNEVRKELGDPSKPLLVKVAPDLSWEALDEIVELTLVRGLSGIVATNTTITRPEASDPRSQRLYGETGGLSGAPLRARSTEIIRHLYRQTGGNLPIVGVGGVFTAADAWEKVTAGASLIQVYTGMVYEGPRIARTLVEGLQRRVREEGLPDLASAVGIAALKG